MKVADFMTTRFQVVPATATLLEAMQLLHDGELQGDEIGIKCVVVQGPQGELLGVLTQSDVVGEVLFPYFVRGLADQAEAESPTIGTGDYRALRAWASRVRVTEVMTREPVTVAPDVSLFEIADTIVSRKVRSVPVVDDGKVVGIVYRTALYRCLANGILHENSHPARGHSGPRGPSIGKSHDSAPAFST